MSNQPDGSIEIDCAGKLPPKVGDRFTTPNGEACEIVEIRAISSAESGPLVAVNGVIPTHRAWFKFAK